jgi:TRAP-type mannitol/chloroaromatic compound transport system permease small subunit
MMSSIETHALNSVRQEDRFQASGPSLLWNTGLGAVARVLNAIGSAWIFGLMCMMLADLGMRFLFNRPIDGVAEVAGLSIVGIVYLQLASAVQGGRMVKADFISQWVARKLPRLGHLLGALFQLLGACTMGLLARVSLEPFVSAWMDHETLGTAGVFQVATWPFRGMVLLGSVLATLCYLTLVFKEISLFFTQGKKP